MAARITISALVGAVLGLRFGVFTLVPVIGIALALIAFSGALRGESIWATTVAMAVVATCTQLGYFASALWLVIGASRGSAVESSKKRDGLHP